MIVFVIAIFLSAALLFAVQPMVGRLVLPSLGGSPAVWNTVMVFFQLSLLAGYALAHGLERFARPRVRAVVHGGMVVGSFGVLPIALPTDLIDRIGDPTLGLLATLLVGVGLPALTLATMSPLLQAWYASLDLPRRDDPYFLYAASNAGSLLGLLSYPLIAEPLWGLSSQLVGWTAGFALLGVALVPIWASLLKGRRSQGMPAPTEPDAPAPMRRGGPMMWVLLAAAPSSLLLGVTQHISTDVAAAPLLWVVPLALYLLTFIAAFSATGRGLHRVTRRVVPVLVVAAVVALLVRASHPLGLIVVLHLAAFVAVALGCHARLAAMRPPPVGLTRYYLFLSLGGVIGGSFNALLAPLLFDWIAEYPIALAAGAALAVGGVDPRIGIKRRGFAARALPGCAVATAAVVILAFPVTWPANAWLGFVGAASVAAYVVSQRPMSFGVAIAGVLLAPGWLRPDEDILARERTFFGVHTVLVEREGEVRRHALRHGGTVHGLQTPGDQTPLTYYHPTGPLGEVFDATDADGRRIGAIGLGVGSLAGLAGRGDRVTFFEIDRAVIDLARDPALFSYLSDSRASIETVVGDGRLTIDGEGPFDLIVLDAFTSDAIPVHLLTAEALAVYLAELAPGGLIAVHVSNRHLDLVPVVGSTAARAGLSGVWREDQATLMEERFGKAQSTWCVLARDGTVLGPFDRGWSPLEPGSARAWTDDYANILATIRLD